MWPVNALRLEWCYDTGNVDKHCCSYLLMINQWRSESIWRPGANLNFAPPPSKKFLKNDNIMSSIQLIMCIIISA